MCGIIGYTGKKQTLPILLDGLKRMEYRGYDSAGIASIESDQKIHITKQAGKLQRLQSDISPENHQGTTGIGHIRWATHGIPNQENAHPHTDCSGDIAIVHNGIIENHTSLREELKKNGHTLKTCTDSELIAHLIEEEVKKDKSLEEATKEALKKLTGTYGLIVISKKEPQKIVAARLGSPIVLGIIDKGEYVVASDVSAIINHTRDVIYLEEDEIITVTPEGHDISSHDFDHISRPAQHIEWEIEKIEKKGYEHFMLKEIHEQPESIKDAMRGRVITNEGLVKLGGIEEAQDRVKKIERLIIVACGTAWHAGLVGEYWLEQLTEIPTELELASEFRYRTLPTDPETTAVIFISQSGETADTIAALREAKRRGLLTIGIVNIVGSTIARETDIGMYNHAGPEIAVASTKAFTSQLTMLLSLALSLGRKKKLPMAESKNILTELEKIPKHIQTILDQKESILEIAKKYSKIKDALYIGRQHSFPIALEGALKLKEISYIHAEGYAAGEMKHGPIALIEPDVPTIAIVPHDSVYEKTLSNMQEIKARSGKIIAITDDADENGLKDIADDIITVPKTLDILTPFLTTIPLQLFAYQIAVERNLDVDKPRNLAKSVTVE